MTDADTSAETLTNYLCNEIRIAQVFSCLTSNNEQRTSNFILDRALVNVRTRMVLVNILSLVLQVSRPNLTGSVDEF